MVIFNTSFKSILFLPMCLWAIYACQSETVASQTVSLNKISKDPIYATMPLIDTKWKLIGFGNTKSNKIQLAQSYNDSSYVILFKPNNLIDGRTSTNKAFGRYTLSVHSLTILYFSNMTEMGEIYDGLRFIETMQRVKNYQITDRGLFLNYGEAEFLLFKPINK